MKKLIALIGLILISSTALKAQNGGDTQPPDGLDEISAYSLFYENYRNEQYEEALKYGRWILKGMPRSIEGYAKFSLSTQLDRLITIYSEIAKSKTDPSLQEAYIDTAGMIFDKVFNTFSKDEIDYYQWYLKKGSFYYNNADFIENAKEKQTAAYKKAFELQPIKTTKAADGYYVKVMLQNLVDRDTEEAKKEALAIVKKAEAEASDDLKAFFDKIRNKLFDSPEERMAFLKKKVEEEPENVEYLRQLRDLYENEGNLDQARKLNEKLYELNPSYQNASSLANLAIENAEYDTAIKYLNEAKNKTDETEKLKTIYLNLAKAYLNKGQLRQARSNARKAINADSNWGQPYILMADIYARAVSQCSDGRDLTRNDRAVYWLVMDYLNKAKSRDSSISSAANSRLRSYRQVTPSKEDIFFMDSWSQGASIRIGGGCYSWINESTTVR